MPSQGNTGHGWFKAMRYTEMPRLVREHRTAFLLAYLLAYRCWWHVDRINRYHLELGEAVCDYQNWGLSEQEFRTAKATLSDWGVATFRATNKGTIGKLIDTRLFSVIASQSNERSNGRTTSRATDGATTYQEPRAKSKEQKSLGAKEGLAGASRCGFAFKPLSAKDLRWLEAQVDVIAERHDLDSDFVGKFKDQHERDGYTIPNKRRGKPEPIKNLEKVLVAFCAKLEKDRCRESNTHA
jgi:hypothetical protein